jgi:hypothetical protein
MKELRDLRDLTMHDAKPVRRGLAAGCSEDPRRRQSAGPAAEWHASDTPRPNGNNTLGIGLR